MQYNRPYTKVVTVAGTAVALDFDDIGYQPSYVKVINLTKKRWIEHIEGMDDASGLVVKEGTGDIFQPAEEKTNGITLHSRGFSLGVQTDINVATDTLVVWAY